MIIIERPKLRFLMAGRILAVPVTDPTRYSIGRTYALGTTHQAPALCRVQIVTIEQLILKIRLAETDPPRLLRPAKIAPRLGDYTDDPHKALPDEPEAVDPRDIERINRRHRERITTFRGDIIATVDMLAESASAADARRLRNLRRIAASL